MPRGLFNFLHVYLQYTFGLSIIPTTFLVPSFLFFGPALNLEQGYFFFALFNYLFAPTLLAFGEQK